MHTGGRVKEGFKCQILSKINQKSWLTIHFILLFLTSTVQYLDLHVKTSWSYINSSWNKHPWELVSNKEEWLLVSIIVFSRKQSQQAFYRYCTSSFLKGQSHKYSQSVLKEGTTMQCSAERSSFIFIF